MGPPHLGQRKPTTVARNINNFQPFVHSRRSHNTLYKIKPTKYFFKNHISHCTAGDVVLAAKASCHWGCSLPKFGPKKFSTEAWSNQVHQQRLVQTKGSAQKFGPNTVQHQTNFHQMVKRPRFHLVHNYTSILQTARHRIQVWPPFHFGFLYVCIAVCFLSFIVFQVQPQTLLKWIKLTQQGLDPGTLITNWERNLSETKHLFTTFNCISLIFSVNWVTS